MERKKLTMIATGTNFVSDSIQMTQVVSSFQFKAISNCAVKLQCLLDEEAREDGEWGETDISLNCEADEIGTFVFQSAIGTFARIVSDQELYNVVAVY